MKDIIILILLFCFVYLIFKKKDYFVESNKKEINLVINITLPIGNMIIAIKNAIHIALFYNYNNVILHKHPFFNETKIIINENENKISKNIYDQYNFFNKERIKDIDMSLFDKNKRKTLEIIRKIFKLKNIKKYNSNEICIHIRGRDLFNSNPHPGYVTPPLDYYVKILNNKKYKNIYLVSEDKKNPTVNELMKLYPNIKFKIQSLEEDIKLILGHENIVFSFGTFLKSLLLLSKNIKIVHKPSYQSFFSDYIPEVKLINYDLNDYKKKQSPWKNTEEQRKLMLSYKLKK
jgi:hypothetical protein